MRIIQISPQTKVYTYKPASSKIAKNNNNEYSAISGCNMGNSIIPKIAYIPAFKGYAEDKSFLGAAVNILKNSLDDVNLVLNDKYKESYGNDFLSALECVEKNPNLYAKVTENPEIFDKLEAGFNLFNNSTLKSLYDVRFYSKQYTKFWEDNSRIGEKRTVDVIRDSVNKKEENINRVIKTANQDEYNSIKSAVIQAWFETAYNLIKQEKPATISKNFDELSKTVNRQYAKTYLLNEKIRLCNEFNKKTKDCLMSHDTDSEQKLRAFKLMMSYIQSKMLEDKDKALDKDYETVIKSQHILEYAKEKESMFYAKYGINLLHGLAFNKWKKDNLTLALNEKLKKEIFYHKEEKANEELSRFQNYRNFDTDAKYFVSRYYDACCKDNNRYNFDEKDYIWQIINDRHNTKPAMQAIKELAMTAKEKETQYFAQLDNFYDLLSEREIDPEVQLPKRIVDTPNDELSFADLYIEKLGKTKKFLQSSEAEKLDYLSQLTKEEMMLLNIELKKDWYKNAQKYSILACVNEQAKNTSVFADMNNELKKINANLDEIRIKTNEMTMSLKEAIENRASLSSQIDADSTIKLSEQISQMQRDYNAMPSEEKKLVDEKFSTIFPALIDSILKEKNKDKQNTDDSISSELLKISKMAASKEPANRVLELTKSILLSQGVRAGITNGYAAGVNIIKHLDDISKVTKVTNNLSWTTLGLSSLSEDSPFGEFFDVTPSIAPENFVAETGTALATGAGALAVKGQFSSIAAAVTNPVSATALVAILVAGGTAAIAANKAKKLEHSQRDLLFEVRL